MSRQNNIANALAIHPRQTSITHANVRVVFGQVSVPVSVVSLANEVAMLKVASNEVSVRKGDVVVLGVGREVNNSQVVVAVVADVAPSTGVSVVPMLVPSDDAVAVGLDVDSVPEDVVVGTVVGNVLVGEEKVCGNPSPVAKNSEEMPLWEVPTVSRA